MYRGCKFLGSRIPNHVSRAAISQDLVKISVQELSKIGTDGVFVLSLNNPANKNALNDEIASSLTEQIYKLGRNENVRVLVFRSNVQKIFCAGADLKERLNMPIEKVEPFVDRLRDLFSLIYDFPAPTIAAIDGIALGGGLELGLSCDIRILSDTSKVGLVETKLAIIPGAGGTQQLPRLIGASLAKELIFTGRILDGTTARELGICNHVVTHNNAGDAAYLKALEIATEISKNGPIALKLAKFAINKGSEVDLQTGLAIEKSCYSRVIPTSDRVEGLKAFTEKRPPRYCGK